MVVCIPLTYLDQQLEIIVDDIDANYTRQFNWHALVSRNTYYARRNTYTDGVEGMILLHRELMKAKDGEKIDHIDGNGLNCTRANMRSATNQQNCINHKRKVGKSGYRGVYKKGNRYIAIMSDNYEQIHIGSFRTLEEAAKARDAAVLARHGEFAVLNFPTLPKTGIMGIDS
jgi:hypothetical protein